MDRTAKLPGRVAFGRFEVRPTRRELLADARPVMLGHRAFDVLLALMEAGGRVVSKDALMARVWGNQVIEENALQAQISALRAALGPDRQLIRTITGRGYQFTGEVSIPPEDADQLPAPAIAHGPPHPPMANGNLPEPPSALISRDQELDEIVGLVREHRLVTLTGPGGIGKSRLALAAGHRLRPQFPDGVWFVELSSLSAPRFLPAVVATAIGLELGGEISAVRLMQALGNRRMLLILDTCEHILDGAATMAEALLHAEPEIHIACTSREPLRAEGEWIYHVPSLEFPRHECEDAGGDLSRYGAVRLFLDKARAAQPNFAPNQAELSAIAAICRRLDGIPLAIELAVARADALGIAATAARLEDRFQLLTGGRRTALPRHQTLRAALDWSYGMLSDAERTVLTRLSVFTGSFEAETAVAVVGGAAFEAPELVKILADLVAKSMVAAQLDGSAVHYRLLDTMRAYALEKLEYGESKEIRRRHAQHQLDMLASFTKESDES